jgi:hypothetical protein
MTASDRLRAWATANEPTFPTAKAAALAVLAELEQARQALRRCGSEGNGRWHLSECLARRLPDDDVCSEDCRAARAALEGKRHPVAEPLDRVYVDTEIHISWGDRFRILLGRVAHLQTETEVYAQPEAGVRAVTVTSRWWVEPFIRRTGAGYAEVVEEPRG